MTPYRAIFVADVGRRIDLDACRRLVPDLVRDADARARSLDVRLASERDEDRIGAKVGILRSGRGATRVTSTSL